MHAIDSLPERKQSLWLDNIPRSLLEQGQLSVCTKDQTITGLSSNPTVFEHSIRQTSLYDEDIFAHSMAGLDSEAIFFALAQKDVCAAADLFLPVFDNTNGHDGWVSLDVSPLIANLSQATLREARRLHQSVCRTNLLVKIPGTPSGLIAVRDAIFEAIPVNITMLFSTEQYLAAASAYMSGIEARLERGFHPVVHSVASISVSSWDVAVRDHVPAALHNQLGLAMAHHIYIAYRAMLVSPRWKKLESAGAVHQRLLWASISTTDPLAPDTVYLDALAASDTIMLTGEMMLQAFIDHGRLIDTMPADSAEADQIITQFVARGFNLRSLAIQLQHESSRTFTSSWYALMMVISRKIIQLPYAASIER